MGIGNIKCQNRTAPSVSNVTSRHYFFTQWQTVYHTWFENTHYVQCGLLCLLHDFIVYFNKDVHTSTTIMLCNMCLNMHVCFNVCGNKLLCVFLHSILHSALIIPCYITFLNFSLNPKILWQTIISSPNFYVFLIFILVVFIVTCVHNCVYWR